VPNNFYFSYTTTKIKITWQYGTLYLQAASLTNSNLFHAITFMLQKNLLDICVLLSVDSKESSITISHSTT